MYVLLEVEALRPDSRNPVANLHPLPELDRGAEVDFSPGEDQSLERVVPQPQRLEVSEPRRLHVGQEHGVVHVPHAVQIAEAHGFAVHEVEAVHARDAIDRSVAGKKTRAAMFAQPDWLRRVPTDRRFPDGRLLFTGCGTSFHAAQAGGEALQALELAVQPRHEADLLVAVSHEGTTPMTLDAVRAWEGPVWLVTGASESPLAAEADEVLVVTPELEQSWCHTASYTCAVAAIAALRGEEVGWLPDAVADALDRDVGEPPPGRVLVAGAGHAWPTAQEAVLKLREGAHLPAEAHHTEQLLHGHLAAVDETVRAYVLDGPRAADAVRALEVLGCETTLVPSVHPVADIVFFQLLTLAAAEARGVNPDVIRRDDERWKRAREAYR
jgi:glutamine---fructose-6-phosphate transaminase (isomerizing)